MSRRLCWAAFMSPGTSSSLRALGVLVGGEAQLIDLHLEVLSLLGALPSRREERLADIAVRVLEMTEVTSRL